MGSLVCPLCTPYYLTLVRLNIGICNPRAPEYVCAGCSPTQQCLAKWTSRDWNQPRCSACQAMSWSHLHKGILGSRNGLVSIPAISQLNRAMNVIATLISIKIWHPIFEIISYNTISRLNLKSYSSLSLPHFVDPFSS